VGGMSFIKLIKALCEVRRREETDDFWRILSRNLSAVDTDITTV
jgi:hypothetical protein